MYHFEIKLNNHGTHYHYTLINHSYISMFSQAKNKSKVSPLPNIELLFVSEYKEAFSLFDKKGTQTIDPTKSLGDLLRSLGKNPTQAQLSEIIPKLHNPLSFDSFVKEVAEMEFSPVGSVDEFIQGFQVFDKDGNGFISSGELRYGIRICSWVFLLFL